MKEREWDRLRHPQRHTTPHPTPPPPPPPSYPPPPPELARLEPSGQLSTALVAIMREEVFEPGRNPCARLAARKPIRELLQECAANSREVTVWWSLLSSREVTPSIVCGRTVQIRPGWSSEHKKAGLGAQVLDALDKYRDELKLCPWHGRSGVCHKQPGG